MTSHAAFYKQGQHKAIYITCISKNNSNQKRRNDMTGLTLSYHITVFVYCPSDVWAAFYINMLPQKSSGNAASYSVQRAVVFQLPWTLFIC